MDMITGKQCYLFASVYDDTRYWLASDLADNKFQHSVNSLLNMTKKQAGKTLRNFIIDSLPIYEIIKKKVFRKKINHAKHTHIAGKRDRGNNNNKMEILNDEIGDREKVFRGLKKMDTNIWNGMRVYYNFTKKYGLLKGRTSARVSLIKVDGTNKWIALIQNVSVYKANSA